MFFVKFSKSLCDFHIQVRPQKTEYTFNDFRLRRKACIFCNKFACRQKIFLTLRKIFSAKHSLNILTAMSILQVSIIESCIIELFRSSINILFQTLNIVVELILLHPDLFGLFLTIRDRKCHR